MTISALTVLEVRSASSDTNGGGFVTGASGTDYSQQNAANSAGSNISTTDAVAVGTTTITSVTAAFTSAIVGNIIYLAGGTGSITAQWRQVTGFTNATTITIDSSIAASTGMTMNIGGALATPAKAISLMTVAGMITYIKAATYAIGTNIVFPTVGGSGGCSYIIGYTTTRGDNGQATLQYTTTGTMISFTTISYSYCWQNIIFDGNSKTASKFYTGSGYDIFWNCSFKNMSGTSALIGGNDFLGIYNSEITGLTQTTNGGCTVTTTGNGGVVIDSTYIHGNTSTTAGAVIGPGTGTYANFTLTGNVFYSTTTGNHVVIDTVCGGLIRNNVFDSAARAGIYYFNSGPAFPSIFNNIFTNNGTYGINASNASLSASGTQATPFIHHNAYYNNTTAAYTGIVAGTGDVTLTGNPYVSVGSNFALNNTTGQGAACRAAGSPGLLPLNGNVGTGYLDIGPLQHQDPAASGSSYVFSG